MPSACVVVVKRQPVTVLRNGDNFIRFSDAGQILDSYIIFENKIGDVRDVAIFHYSSSLHIKQCRTLLTAVG